jgi:hypothetical protein
VSKITPEELTDLGVGGTLPKTAGVEFEKEFWAKKKKTKRKVFQELLVFSNCASARANISMVG